MDEVLTHLVSAINLLFLLASAWLFFHYWWERRAIATFAIKAIDGAQHPLEEVLALSGEILNSLGSLASHHEDPDFIPIRGLSALGPTPKSVLLRGGCCSGRSRLTTVCLHSLGYKAWQATLYHMSGTAQHCLVEASVGGHNILIDTSYGFYYVTDAGTPLGSSNLRDGQRPAFVSLPGSVQNAYPQDDYYNFDYRNTKTANWTMSLPRRASYRVLYFLTAGRIDRLKQPAFLEWPQLILASAIGIVLLIFNALLAML